MPQILNLEIDVTKFLKEEFQRRPRGIIATVTVFLNDAPDDTGAFGLIVQDLGKDRRGPILGNVVKRIERAEKKERPLAEIMNEQALAAQQQVRRPQ